jgi:hypothetical protein
METVMKNYSDLIDTLEARSADYLREEGEGGLMWVLLEDAADSIKVLTGQRHLDRLLSNGTADQLEQVFDRLLFIYNVIASDPDVSVQWIYTELEVILSGYKGNE